MKRHTAVAVILITILIAGCSALSAQEETKSAPKPEPKVTNWYKIEVTLDEFQDGKKTNTRSYTMEAEENGPAAVMKLGDRVPVATGGSNVGFVYIDVGLDITSRIREQQNRLGLTLSVEQSSVVPPTEAVRVAPNQPIIRQLKMENTAFVTPGKLMLVASVDDPGKANHKYTVEATVTKLNP